MCIEYVQSASEQENDAESVDPVRDADWQPMAIEGLSGFRVRKRPSTLGDQRSDDAFDVHRHLAPKIDDRRKEQDDCCAHAALLWVFDQWGREPAEEFSCDVAVTGAVARARRLKQRGS